MIGYGYSQSGRFLREFVRDGFNADERGRAAFDGLMISSAGAGGGSFNHRFAMPGQAGNSVLSVLRPVDLPPFTDDGLLAKARAARVSRRRSSIRSRPRNTGRAPDRSRIRATTGAPMRRWPRHRASTSWPALRIRWAGFRSRRAAINIGSFVNFAEQRWVTRALLVELDAWTRSDTRAAVVAVSGDRRKGELVPLEDVRFPKVPSFPFATYMPRVWRMDYGPEYTDDASDHDRAAADRRAVSRARAAGQRRRQRRRPAFGLPEVAVPLGTYTGWNVTVPQLSELAISERTRRRIRAVRQDERAAHRERRQPAVDRRTLQRTAGLSRQGQACRRRSRAPAVPACRRRAGRAAISRADVERRRSRSIRYRDAPRRATQAALASHR